MTDKITFSLNGETVAASADETIWQVAKRLGTTIPHLCFKDADGYRADGNCRACMVEIEGERVLAASCNRKPAEGMVVHSNSTRATSSRNMVMELLLADQPEQAHDDQSDFQLWAQRMEISTSRFPGRQMPSPDVTHPAMAVNLDACIHCNLCVRACREVQVNDVIGMAGSGTHAKITFDFDDPMGASTCVGCGECVQACPTGALMAKTAMIDKADKQVQSVCPYCGVGCQITYNIADNKIISVDGAGGPANENRLCIKGRFGFDYVASPERLTQPLIRKPGFEKGVNLDPARPLEAFRTATWDEALDFAASSLVKTREQSGPRSLAGFGSAKCSNEEAYLFQKLVRTGFGSNNVDHCTRLCHASSVAALMETIGSGAVTAPFTAVKDSDLIVVIGANPTENHPVAATYFKQAVKNGADLIVMDPRAQALKRHATHMLQFKPGSDVALLNAMMHVIIEEGLYDEQYIQTHTQGFENLRQHLAAFPPEQMEKVCGIDAEIIKTVARKYATAKAAIIFWGMGISQHTHGTDNARCLISLTLMCGQTGRPGTGLHPLRGQNNVQGASDAALIPMFFPDYKRVDNKDEHARFEALWNSKLDSQPGLTVVETINAIHDDKIRAMYIMGENPAMSDPDLNHARSALAKLDHLVVQDIFLTETAMFADVVLPATAWPEKDGTVSNTNRQVQMGRKALDAPGDAKPDWWITMQLANRLGLNWDYAGPQQVFNEMKQAMPSLDNITWQRLQTENVVAYPCSAPDHPGLDIVFADRFPTENGRGKFVAASVLAPDEQPDDQYPFILSTGRQLEHWHTGAMTRRSSVLDAMEPEAIVQMNVADIEKFGISAGDFVEINSRRGSIKIRARADNKVPSGVIFIPFAFVEAAANLLTNPQLDPVGKIPEFKYCAVAITPV
ncbi:Tungsten-containing formate dehydrogenase alpha subunit [hydrothermal vent metagenome]|uniref:Tungsten-containing formate dehydrogenase alpha subunit n=1 Tax=hydrothermal vent metagenome TaxID=652676 RepID=A0A3B0RMA1_9ZZZZ